MDPLLDSPTPPSPSSTNVYNAESNGLHTSDTKDITVFTIYPQFFILKQIISVLTNIANKAYNSLASSPEIKI